MFKWVLIVKLENGDKNVYRYDKMSDALDKIHDLVYDPTNYLEPAPVKFTIERMYIYGD